jgi:hypothetical protein
MRLRIGVRQYARASEAEAPVPSVYGWGVAPFVALDTTRPGEDPGALDAERLEWLDAELAQRPEVLTLLAMHHPPLAAGRAVLTVPNPACRIRLDFQAREIELAVEPAASRSTPSSTAS